MKEVDVLLFFILIVVSHWRSMLLMLDRKLCWSAYSLSVGEPPPCVMWPASRRPRSGLIISTSLVPGTAEKSGPSYFYLTSNQGLGEADEHPPMLS